MTTTTLLPGQMRLTLEIAHEGEDEQTVVDKFGGVLDIHGLPPTGIADRADEIIAETIFRYFGLRPVLEKEDDQ